MASRTVARALGVVLALSATAALPSAHLTLAQEPPGSGEPVRLGDVLRQVQEANPSLRAARLGADALGTRARQASALPDPTVGVTYQPLPILTARGAQRTQWRVEQMVPFPGKRALQGEIAGLSADVAASEADALAADLLLEAKKAYYALYRTQQVEALVQDFQDELRSFEEAATVRYEVGEGAQQAVLKAQLEKQKLAERLIGLQTRQRQAAETLARLTGRPGDVRRFQRVALERPPVPDLDAAGLLPIALQERPEVDALDAATTRAARQVDLAKKQFLPDVGLSLTYFDIADTEMPPSATGRDALALGAMIKVPLQRGRLRAQLEEARLRQAEIGGAAGGAADRVRDRDRGPPLRPRAGGADARRLPDDPPPPGRHDGRGVAGRLHHRARRLPQPPRRRTQPVHAPHRLRGRPLPLPRDGRPPGANAPGRRHDGAGSELDVRPHPERA